MPPKAKSIWAPGPAPKRSISTRSSTLAERPTKRTKTFVRDSEDEEDASMDELSPQKTASKGKGQAKSTNIAEPQSRASLSTVSTARDSVESSFYSTPGTSAAATPAAIDGAMNEVSVLVPKTAPTLVDGLDMEALDALDADLAAKNAIMFKRLKEMRSRKKPSQEEDDERKAERDEEASLQLAMSLQREEYGELSAPKPSPRNSSRPSRSVTRARTYVADSEDSDDEYDDDIPLASTKPPKKAFFNDKDAENDVYDDSDDEPLHHIASRRQPTSSWPRSNNVSYPNQQRGVKIELSRAESPLSGLTDLDSDEERSDVDADIVGGQSTIDSDEDEPPLPPGANRGQRREAKRAHTERLKLETQHPEIKTMWRDLAALTDIPRAKAQQPATITRTLKPFQLEGLHWMQEMEKTAWGGGLLGDEMGMGKTIQAVSLIMSDYPAKDPSLVMVPPVALMQWQQEMRDYTDNLLKTFVYHGTNAQTKRLTLEDLKNYDVILMSYNSLEAMYRKEEKGAMQNGKACKAKSIIHQLHFHRVILDEAHCIKSRQTSTAKACFALRADHKWCLTGTPLQNRIGEFFSLIRFLGIRPYACYFCKSCPCSKLEWKMDKAKSKCTDCGHVSMHHISVFNHELLNPIQKYGDKGRGKKAFAKLHMLTDRFMLRRIKRDQSSAMELPAKEIYVDRHFFGEEENDLAKSIMHNTKRRFQTYVSEGVMLRNYANIFGLIMQMRQVADHPDLILKKHAEGGRNMLVCCICDEIADEPIRSHCKHDFCRACIKAYLEAMQESEEPEEPDCPRCHILLSIDLEQAAVVQDAALVKKNSIINRIKMENWTSSSKIEALVYDLHELRSRHSSCKSIIFSQFTSMLQLVEWRLNRAGISTVMLDGSMTPAQRQASIDHFMKNVEVECFLVSLKAGGVALNLTEASKVFIIDPWWNPAAEWQSADRCHRIGQNRPCTITRLCIEDSVEARMVLLQEKKANMIHGTMNHDTSAMECLSAQDMQFLFRGN